MNLKICSLIAAVYAVMAGDCQAGEIVLPSSALARDGTIRATYRMNSQFSGEGKLTLRWTDSLGRIVEVRTIPVTLSDEDEISFPLDLRRAVAMRNELHVHLSVQGKTLQKAELREEDAQTVFIARPPGASWRDYEIVMWQPYAAHLLPALRELGISGGQFRGRGGAVPSAFIGANMRWYSENIATDFYAEYHRFRPDRVPHWSFLQAKELWKSDPSSKEAFKRNPSLWDPVWRKKIQDRAVETAKANAPYAPIFYSLADESGIADLAAFWDFDFSDMSLVPMRRWLKQRYGTLAAVNREWETAFKTWDLVTPPTTQEAMARKGDNFAAWADFKEWMDVSFEDALRMGTDAIRGVVPNAFVSIGGGQRPGWGGYDYARITRALTAIEPYDIGSNVEIIRSLNPNMAMVATSFARGPWEQQRVWRGLLHGQRGAIIWDEKREFVDANGQPGARGLEVKPYYRELRDGLGALIVNSQPVNEPIAIHYSQASMRTDWMLARRPHGTEWVDRGAKTDRTDDEFLRLRESWCELIEDQGMQYKFIAYDRVEEGELLKSGYRIFIMPRSNSLSKAEVDAIREFIGQGGTVIADGEPGTFNEHSRRLEASPLVDIFGGPHDQPVTTRHFGRGKAIFLKTDTLSYLMDRLVKKEGPVHKLVGDLLRQDVRPRIGVTDTAGAVVVGVEAHVFDNGGVTLITLLSNPLQRVDELGPPEFRSNGRFESPVDVTVTLPAAAHVYEVRTGRSLGVRKTLPVTVTPYEPVIVAASPSPLPAMRVSAPAEARLGDSVTIGFSSEGTDATMHVLHVDVIDPSGKQLPAYSGNVLAPRGRASKHLPLAMNDPAGVWKLRVRDALSGQTQVLSLRVTGPASALPE